MKPKYFRSPADLRNWFEKNHDAKTELLVGYYKIGTGKPSVTWPQSVDEALCFGWIDGIRKSIDDKSYCIRFTPRKPSSNWSSVNIKKIEELTKAGLMKPAGLAAFQKRLEHKSRVYSYENKPAVLPEEYKNKLEANKKAFSFFNTLPTYTRKVIIKWVMSAKQESTRIRRLEELINDSEAGQLIKALRYFSKK